MKIDIYNWQLHGSQDQSRAPNDIEIWSKYLGEKEDTRKKAHREFILSKNQEVGCHCKESNVLWYFQSHFDVL